MESPIEKLPFVVNIILTVLLDPIWQGVNRIMRNRNDAVMILVGVLWILTLGLFGVGWIFDIVTMAMYKEIRLLA